MCAGPSGAQEALLLGQSVSVNPQFIQNYNQNSTGFTASASYPVKHLSFTRLGLTYGLTRTNIQAFNDASRLLFRLSSLNKPDSIDLITLAASCSKRTKQSAT